ncbi:MAG: alpha-galactosidase [Tannerellaceae bacterium]|jgi:hypothetical protein|nr:alpha-galactosidase [Tannerellaceae bacterium]
MIKRRDFIRKAAMGSMAIAALPGFGNAGYANTAGKLPEGNDPVWDGWKESFDEKEAVLSIQNGPVVLTGKLKFVSGQQEWKIVRSRDGVPERYALVDLQENVQGYLVCIPQATGIRILFYHRTAQSYAGIWSWTGEIHFLQGSFPCRTGVKAGERVLPLSSGAADSLLNDSLFSPETDTALQLSAAHLRIKTLNDKLYAFEMSGHIDETAEAGFSINLEWHYLKNRYVPYYRPIDRKRCPKAPTGWMSWNTYFDKATAEDNLNEARIGKKYLQPFGCEFWSIESWQGNSDRLPVSDFYNMNLEVNEKQFPKGMKKLADDIRALGFRPGLWMAPFGTGNTGFYEAHKHWFLHDREGVPVASWNGRYTLDPTVREAREHLKKIHRIASREWGYEFFKIDGMSGRNHGYCAHLYERPEIKACFSNPSCPNPFELCVQAFREGIGEDRVLLACQGHTSGPEALYADASRIGADIVHPNKPVEWSGVLNQGRCFVNQAFTHNIVMYADPDTLLVRELSPEEARTSATIVALPGQLTFFGDKLAGLPDDRMKILQQTLPVAEVRPGSLYPYFSMLPVWNLNVHHDKLGDYNVVAFFNWEDLPETITATAEELGIDPHIGYTGYEFWTEKALKVANATLAVEVPAHGVRVVVLHPVKSVPQWVGSDRHIAQNAMEISDCAWNSERTALEGKIRLVGSFPLTMRLRIPENYTCTGATCNGAVCPARQEPDNLLAITFLSRKTNESTFNILFSKRSASGTEK